MFYTIINKVKACWKKALLPPSMGRAGVGLLFFLCLGMGARADNVVCIGTASGAPGDEVTLSISLQNTSQVAALQLSVPLDEELSYVDGSASLAERCSASHSVTAGVKDGELNVMVYSLDMTAISGTEGEVATLRLKLGNQPKTITLSASKLLLTDTGGNTINDATSTNGSVNIQCAKAQYTLDGGNDGNITVGNRSTISNVPFGSYPPYISTDILYTAQQLKDFGLKPGQVITSLRFVSTSGSGDLSSLSLKMWVGAMTDETTFIPGNADKSRMKEFSLYDNETTSINSPFTIMLDLSDSPIVFDGKNGIRVLTEKLADKSIFVYFNIDNNYKDSYTKSGYSLSAYERASWQSTPVGNPILYITLDNSIPEPIDFSRVPIRGIYEKSLKVTNVGNLPLTIDGLQFSNYVTKFSSTTQFPMTIAAGESSLINITYAPEERGTVNETVKVLCNSISKLNNITLMAQPFAVNELHVQPASGFADETVTVSLTMNNMDAVSGFQFEFTLPSQLEFVPNSFVLSDRKANHAVVQSVTNGVLRIICYSPSDTPFTGEDGELATMQFRLSGRNSTTLKPSKCVLTATIDNQVTNVCSADYGATITIKSPRLNANSTLNMGSTPVTSDAVSNFVVRNYGNAPLTISRIAFNNEDFYIQEDLPLTINANGNATLHVVCPNTTEGDFETFMQIYSNDPEQRLWNVTVTGNRFAPNYFDIGTADVSAFDNVSIDVAVNTYDPIVGIQFDLTYPSQAYEPFVNNHILEPRAEGMSVTWRQIDNNTLRYFCYFLSNNGIAAGDGKVMSLLLRPIGGGAPLGQYTVGVKDIKLGTNEMADKYAGQDCQSSFNVLAPAGPVISHDEGEYNEPLTVAISFPKDNADIYYSIGGEFVKYTEPFILTGTATVEAYAQMFGYETERVAKTFTITSGETGPSITEGYYSILNNGNQKYAQAKGRMEVGFSETKEREAGTVIKLKATDGKVETLRSQGIDVPQSIMRAMRYVPDVVSLVVEKFNLSGPGTLLGTTGVDKIMEKFNQSVDFNLYLEDVGSSMYRIYGKTPSMAPVVNFYIENKEKADIKLAGLEQTINDAIGKVVDKAGIGESLKNSFSLHMVWERIANDELTEPVDEETKLAFLQEVLSSEQHAWQFAYQTALFYMEFVEEKQQFQDLMNGMPEYSQYWERIKDIRPGVRFYLIQEGDGMGIAREDKVDNNGCEVWQLEERNAITVRFPTANKANGKYYTTLYTDFGYTLPDGVRALKVTDIDSYGIATAEVIGTQVAAQCPVLLESNTAGDIDITITDIAGSLEGNVLVGNDYLVNQYGIYNPTIASLFEAAQGIFGETTYNKYLKEYEHLRFRNAGMVGNKYFLGLDEDDLEKCVAEDGSGERHCVARALGVQDGRLGFYEDWSSNENKSFLVTTKFESIYLRIIGDVNRDGFITIADVTALVNIILGKDNVEPYAYDHYAADVNGDGSITIPDVTALVNVILGKQ